MSMHFVDFPLFLEILGRKQESEKKLKNLSEKKTAYEKELAEKRKEREKEKEENERVLRESLAKEKTKMEQEKAKRNVRLDGDWLTTLKMEFK